MYEKKMKRKDYIVYNMRVYNNNSNMRPGLLGARERVHIRRITRSVL